MRNCDCVLRLRSDETYSGISCSSVSAGRYADVVYDPEILRPNHFATTSEKLVTMERKVETNMYNAVTLEIDSQHQPQEGWDDDIDLDDFDGSDNGLDLIINDGVDEQTATAPAYNASSCPIHDGIAKTDRSPDDVIASDDGAYDPVTDITPTRIRYKNPIGGSRDIRYI